MLSGYLNPANRPNSHTYIFVDWQKTLILLANYTFIMEQSVILEHEGNFSVERIDELLRELKSRLKDLSITRLYAKRIYSLSVECLDNIFKHADIDLKENAPVDAYPAFFRVTQEDDKHFCIRSGNLTPATNESRLKTRLAELESLSIEEVNELYKQALSNSEISEKGGAGLGLIVMTRISGQKLQYNLNQVNPDWVFFDLTIHLYPKENR